MNYKNHLKRKYDFLESTIGFTGLNGVGKTNILDAIYSLGFTKSYFGALDKNCINHHHDFFRIEGVFVKNDKTFKVILALQHGKRKILEVNGVSYKKVSEHIGRFPMVVVAPDDNVLILGGSEERRKFIDPILAQVSNSYLASLTKYQKVLSQRNALLKNAKDAPLDVKLLQVYDEQLIPLGTAIHQARTLFVKEFESYFNTSYQAITNKKEAFTLDYESQLNDASFAQALKEHRKKDEILHRTTAGIHKDDLLFLMGGRKVKQYGSQGQQKSFLLALKLAQYHYLKDQLNVSPLFLIDDMFDKLDAERSERAVNYINKELEQVFITHTNSDRLKDALGKGGIQIEEIKNE